MWCQKQQNLNQNENYFKISSVPHRGVKFEFNSGQGRIE
jgi:hypothetical protein